ncbi:MAG: hypothetical protein IPP15_22585 [Saprospiraceae bacterium]|uniref:HYR domain-containing protein n=1 Tax=Candidatus Opimibacter skivensis TaxID=2982028 RepID=A0A9D7XUP0_9BACT|nr:hypothetical protein [Candidatus Opimibacter skivensis]
MIRQPNRLNSGSVGTNSCMATAGGLFAFDAVAAAGGYTDNCLGSVTAVETGTEVVTGTDCAWIVTYTFSVQDACGNILPGQTYTHTGSDQTAPTLTGVPFAGTTGTNACMANAATAAPFIGASAILGYTDNCLGVVTATLTGTAVTGTDCSWTVTYTFTILDECLNSFPGQTYANTGSDLTAPVITTGTIASCYPTVAEAEAAALLATTEIDDCPGVITETASTVGTCSAVVTVTETDGCGNVSSTTYTTRIDNTAPVITTGTIASCYPTVAEAEAAALLATTEIDDCPGVITETASTVGTCSAVVTVTETDGCGNVLDDIRYTDR